MTLSIFSYVYGSSVCPLWRSVYSGPLPIFNWIVYFFGVEFYKFFNKFWILTSYQIYHSWILSPTKWCFPLLCKNFLVWHSPICLFSLLIHFSLVIYQKKVLLQEISEFLLCIFSGIFMVLSLTFNLKVTDHQKNAN